MAVLTGLAKVTINAPRRRIDVALPEQVPLAELLPDLLGHAGEALADEGERHGGWLLRRADGQPLDAALALAAQGVRDGEVLYLVPAREEWPELGYDDVVDAIAAAARRDGRVWAPAATRAVTVVAAGVALAAGAYAVVAGGLPWTVAATVAALLLLAGTAASRAYGEGLLGAALAAYAMAYAFLGGALVVTDGPARLLTGSAAVLLAATLGGVGVAATRWLFVAGGTAGLQGAFGALLAFALPPAGAAAVVLVVLVCGLGALPLLAVRLGRLPMPPVTPPAAQGAQSPTERPERSAVLAAVRRANDVLTGMLAGQAVAGAAASLLLVREGGVAGALLVGVSGAVLLLRGRLFAAARQRVPVLAGGLAALATLLLALADRAGDGRALPLLTALVAAAGLVLWAGATYAKRPPSPYLGRAADLLDVVLTVSVIPIGCAVLDLYATVRGLIG